MIDKKYGVGIVGAGWFATLHSKVYKNNINTEVVAVCDQNLEKVEIFKKECDLVNAKIYNNFQEMLEQNGLDIVSICTPNYLHAEEGILAAKAKKHLYIEKPIAITLESLYLLQDEINKVGIKSMVGFDFREYPLLGIIKNFIDSKSIGDIFYSEIDYKSGMASDYYGGFHWLRKKSTGGSSFLIAGCHAIDDMRWFLGGETIEVYAYSGGWDKQYEYNATNVAIIKFSNGIIHEFRRLQNNEQVKIDNLHREP